MRSIGAVEIESYWTAREREPLFRSQGMKHPMPRIRMVDGFNEGWIDFESGEAGTRKGRTTLEEVLGGLVGSDR